MSSYERTDKAVQKRSRVIRWGVLGVVLAAITGIAYGHQYIQGSGKPVGIDALCPFGGIETLWTWISGAGFVEKTAASALVLFAGTIVLALVYRRSFCGQICPLGTLQGLFGSLGGRFMRKRPQVPRVIDHFARYLKYVVLAVFTVWTWQAAELVIRPYDPWATYAHLTSGELLTEFGVGLAVLGVSLAGSLIYERFFCKYLCPMGAFLGIMSKLSFLGIKRDEDACINCNLCTKACPMNIEVATADTVTSSECISCNECVNVCPAQGALEVKTTAGTTFSATATTVIVVGVLAVIIAGATFANAFGWTMPTLQESIEQEREHVEEPGEGAAGTVETGTFDTALIKGSTSMSEVAEASGIPAERFTEQYGVPAADLGKPMKDIKDQYEFTPEDVRAWVAEEMVK